MEPRKPCIFSDSDSPENRAEAITSSARGKARRRIKGPPGLNGHEGCGGGREGGYWAVVSWSGSSRPDIPASFAGFFAALAELCEKIDQSANMGSSNAYRESGLAAVWSNVNRRLPGSWPGSACRFAASGMPAARLAALVRSSTDRRGSARQRDLQSGLDQHLRR